MPKYLVQGSYTVDGTKGLLAEGGSARVAAVRQLFEASGGKLESMYFTFGSDDFVIIAESADDVAASALSLMVTASGAVKIRTTPLIMPEEIDAATQQAVSYRPPGQ
jgi:uncharacterized protein with GYD domain